MNLKLRHYCWLVVSYFVEQTVSLQPQANSSHYVLKTLTAGGDYIP